MAPLLPIVVRPKITHGLPNQLHDNYTIQLVVLLLRTKESGEDIYKGLVPRGPAISHSKHSENYCLELFINLTGQEIP
jgi:hypothetical protein